MNKIDIARGIVFQKLNLRKDSFDNRLICQKKIYLLQELGINLGYHFDWMDYGPYSKTLASYINDNFDILKECDFSAYKLKPHVVNNIVTVNRLEKENTINITSAQWYELLGSLLFINENFSIFEKEKNCNHENIINKLVAEKPRYTDLQCVAAMDCLDKYHFIRKLD